jgi:DNA-binding transcriptional MerR regulator
MRISELSRRSGVARETIHFYLREGLLPKPKKGGQTIAFYGEEHVERLALIRRMREKYLPLSVIRRLLDAPMAADERDVDALAEVLDIIPTAPAGGRPPSDEARREAQARSLLGPVRVATDDAAERRVLAAIDEALAFEGGARALTLADLEVCARDLTGMVAREAGAFFELVLASGEVGGSIAALRAGRGAVARFIAAYRDLMMRRAVEDLIGAIQRGADAVARTAWVPLSAAREEELGAPARARELENAVRTAPDDELGQRAALYVRHLFARGRAAELAALPPHVVASLPPREAVLRAFGVQQSDRSAAALRDLERRAAGASTSPLAQVLIAEAAIARALRRREPGESVLAEAVPALHRLVVADPDAETDAWAASLAWFHRGRLELALPSVLCRGSRGVAAVERALELARGGGGAGLEAAARARLELNAHLALARHRAAENDPIGARAALEAAVEEDPGGPVALVAAAELAEIDKGPASARPT